MKNEPQDHNHSSHNMDHTKHNDQSSREEMNHKKDEHSGHNHSEHHGHMSQDFLKSNKEMGIPIMKFKSIISPQMWLIHLLER